MRAESRMSPLAARTGATRLAGVAALVLACHGCTPKSTQVTVSTGTSGAKETSAPGVAVTTGASTSRLVIGIDQEPDKLNSALNAMVYGTYINNAIYGYFVKYDEKMNLIPDVITDVPTLENGGISADGLTYTYHLRPGLKWHDGQPFTSDDVMFSLDAIMDPRHEIESRTGYDQIKSKEAPDALTVVMHLGKPYAPFVEGIFFSEGVMPRHAFAGPGQAGSSAAAGGAAAASDGFSSAPFQRAPIGLGPYKFKEWVTGSHITVVANPDYWRGKPSIEEITFRFIPDTNSLLTALKAGEIEGYDNAGTDQRPELDRIPSVKTYVTPQLMWEHVDFNVEDPILSDVRVRQAIQLAIDRDELSKEVYASVWPAAHGDISPLLPKWYDSKVEQLVRFDPEASRKLLDEAGWKPGAGGIRMKGGKKLALEISTTAGRVQRELAEQVLQQSLQQVGIELTIRNHNPTEFFAPYEQNGTLKTGHFQMGMYAWITSPDPNKQSLYAGNQVPPPEGQNYSRMKDAHLDDLMERGLHLLTYEERKPIYDEIQEIIATKVPMTPLVWRADVDPMPARLENFKPNPTQNGDTWNIWEWKLSGAAPASAPSGG